MRRAVIGLALAALALTPAGASAKSGKQACAKRGETIAANAAARVFTYWKGEHPRVYACVYGQKPRVLGRYNLESLPVTDRTMLLEVQLNRRFATGAYETCPHTTGLGCEQRVLTIDLRSGQVTRDARGFGSRPVLVTAPDGSFAFGFEEGQGGAEIVAAGPGGAELLDRADSGIDIFSVAIAPDRTVYWYNGDERRSARLP